MEAIKYLTQCGLLKATPEARARWLSHYRRMVLDNPLIIEWLCQVFETVTFFLLI